MPPVNWTDLSTNTADALGIYQFTDAVPTNAPSRFYRSVYHKNASREYLIRGPAFDGLSGVLCGLLGHIWMRDWIDRDVQLEA
jgi:hypothetical protein